MTLFLLRRGIIWSRVTCADMAAPKGDAQPSLSGIISNFHPISSRIYQSGQKIHTESSRYWTLRYLFWGGGACTRYCKHEKTEDEEMLDCFYCSLELDVICFRRWQVIRWSQLSTFFHSGLRVCSFTCTCNWTSWLAINRDTQGTNAGIKLNSLPVLCIRHTTLLSWCTFFLIFHILSQS